MTRKQKIERIKEINVLILELKLEKGQLQIDLKDEYEQLKEVLEINKESEKVYPIYPPSPFIWNERTDKQTLPYSPFYVGDPVEPPYRITCSRN